MKLGPKAPADFWGPHNAKAATGKSGGKGKTFTGTPGNAKESAAVLKLRKSGGSGLPGTN